MLGGAADATPYLLYYRLIAGAGDVDAAADGAGGGAAHWRTFVERIARDDGGSAP
jgi:hypothetical protein